MLISSVNIVPNQPWWCIGQQVGRYWVHISGLASTQSEFWKKPPQKTQDLFKQKTILTLSITVLMLLECKLSAIFCNKNKRHWQINKHFKKLKSAVLSTYIDLAHSTTNLDIKLAVLLLLMLLLLNTCPESIKFLTGGKT